MTTARQSLIFSGNFRNCTHDDILMGCRQSIPPVFPTGKPVLPQRVPLTNPLVVVSTLATLSGTGTTFAMPTKSSTQITSSQFSGVFSDTIVATAISTSADVGLPAATNSFREKDSQKGAPTSVLVVTETLESTSMSTVVTTIAIQPSATTATGELPVTSQSAGNQVQTTTAYTNVAVSTTELTVTSLGAVSSDTINAEPRESKLRDSLQDSHPFAISSIILASPSSSYPKTSLSKMTTSAQRSCKNVLCYDAPTTAPNFEIITKIETGTLINGHTYDGLVVSLNPPGGSISTFTFVYASLTTGSLKTTPTSSNVVVSTVTVPATVSPTPPASTSSDFSSTSSITSSASITTTFSTSTITVESSSAASSALVANPALVENQAYHPSLAVVLPLIFFLVLPTLFVISFLLYRSKCPDQYASAEPYCPVRFVIRQTAKIPRIGALLERYERNKGIRHRQRDYMTRRTRDWRSRDSGISESKPINAEQDTHTMSSEKGTVKPSLDKDEWLRQDMLQHCARSRAQSTASATPNTVENHNAMLRPSGSDRSMDSYRIVTSPSSPPPIPPAQEVHLNPAAEIRNYAPGKLTGDSLTKSQASWSPFSSGESKPNLRTMVRAEREKRLQEEAVISRANLGTTGTAETTESPAQRSDKQEQQDNAGHEKLYTESVPPIPLRSPDRIGRQFGGL